MNAAAPDVVVIGSGFGGSVVANRLALAGHKVLVLERGPWRDTLPVRSMGVRRRSPLPEGMRLFTHALRSVHTPRFDLTLNRAGLLEYNSTPGLGIAVASGVGGGSLAYGGLLQKPVVENFWAGRHPALAAEDVEKYYAKVLDDMGATPYARDWCQPQSVWDHLPTSGDYRCRPAKAQPGMAFLRPHLPAEAGRIMHFDDGLERQVCNFDGDSFSGSGGGAKASVDFIYLRPVLGRGVTVCDMCEVTEIRRTLQGRSGDYEVSFTDLTAGRRKFVRARHVILAAGTVNTLRLLFASTVAAGLAPMLSLGRTIGANGDLVGSWYRKSPPHSSLHGMPSLGAFSVDGHETAMLALASLAGFGKLPLPTWLKNKLARLFVIIGMGADSGNGFAEFVNGRLQIRYDAAREPIFEEIRASFRELANQSGERTNALGKPITVHPWGGACVGAEASKGVVDHRGEVFGNPGLFIADGSVLPVAPAGPPAVAIAAWAHHVADSLAPRLHAELTC